MCSWESPTSKGKKNSQEPLTGSSRQAAKNRRVLGQGPQRRRLRDQNHPVRQESNSYSTEMLTRTPVTEVSWQPPYGPFQWKGDSQTVEERTDMGERTTLTAEKRGGDMSPCLDRSITSSRDKLEQRDKRVYEL